MSRNKRNSLRTRQDGDAPLPLSQQLAAAIEEAPKAEDGSVDYVKAWTAPAEVDPVGEDLGDVAPTEQIVQVTSVTRDGERLIVDVSDPAVTVAETTDEQKALIWFFKSDLGLASRWSTHLANEPDRLVYEPITETELNFTGVDFSGDTFAEATPWIVEQYSIWRDSQVEATTDEPETGSDDELDVAEAATVSDPDAAAQTLHYADVRARYSLPDNWTDAAIDDWVKHEGYNLGTTARGNFVYDPTRFSERGLSSYTTTELVDAIEGKLDGDYSDVLGDIANIYRQREAVDAAWSVRDLIDFLQQGLLPAKTSTGAWRNDVTRARRLAQDWTTQELTAWAKKEITAVGEVTDMKAAHELNRRLDLGIVTVTPEDVRRVYERLQSNAVKVVGEQPTAITPPATLPEPVASKEPEIVIPQGLTAMNAAYLKTQTERYAKACAPGTPITAEAGAKEQRELDNLFRYILKIEDPAGFGNAMGYIRDFFKKNREGLFDPQYAFRFTGTLRVDGDVQETHVNLLNILQVYTDDNKSARKQIDLPFLLRKFPSARQGWLLEFFQKYC